MSDELERARRPGQVGVPVCAIGASAGGISALQGLFRALPSDLGIAYVVILHLAPDQPSALSEILAAATAMPVLQIDDGPTLKPNCVFVIPPDRELVIEGDSVTARPFTQPRGRRAPIDMFFRSIAAARGDGIAVVLSGAGADGALGVRAVKEAGGVIMVQEPAEAGFGSMPQNAIATGMADFVAPLARLAERLVEVAHSKEAVRSLDMDGSANDLRRIVAFLRSRTGHDFSSYKRATVMRRVLRRMQVCRAQTLAAYADYLLTTPEEAKELFSDLLISVTMFFRDPHAFEALERHVIEPLFNALDPGSDDGIRAWVVGCATGEEAYSLAILVHEVAARRKLHPKAQIFATDLDEGALATAREGRYPRSIEADISEERLSRFFVDEGTHYRVRKELRDSVLFATHSVIKEPPFMRLDLITCRNLLIYLERSLQHQLCTIFHYGLKPGRFLFLGSAETADAAIDVFAPIDRDARLYAARPHAARTLPLLPQFVAPDRITHPEHLAPVRGERADVPGFLHVAALERSAPPSVLVDDGQSILHLSANAGRFILHSAGPVSNLLPAVVRPELRLDLRLALARALDAGEPTLTHPTVVAMDGGYRRIAMHVNPVANKANMGAQALVLFLDGGGVPDRDVLLDPAPDTRPDEVRRLHSELKSAQEALVTSRNGHEAAVQDLRATNEELQSINEEYRSTAEELETSKEELQSINEELHTVNAELKGKLSSISVAHSDLQNLTAATEIGTLFLDPDLRIKMFTAPIAELFNVTTRDIGRTVTDFTHRLEYDDLERDVRRLITTLAPIEAEVRSKDGHWYVVRLRPYRTVEDRIDGAVVTFVDITDRREAERALRASEGRFRRLFANNMVPMGIWTQEGTIPDANDALLAMLGRTRAELEVAALRWDELTPPEHHARDLQAISELQTRGWCAPYEKAFRHRDGHLVPIIIGGGSLDQPSGRGAFFAVDLTDRARAEAALRASEERLRTLIGGIPQLVWRSSGDGRWTWVSPQWLQFTGQAEAESLGWGWIDVVHPDDRDATRLAWQGGRPTGRLDVEFRIWRASDGTWRWHQTRSAPLRAEPGSVWAEGTITEWLGTTTDIEDLKRLQEQQQTLVAELQHRTRNLLAVVRSVARRSMGPSAGRDQYDARLAALGRVQGFLSRSPLYKVKLADLIEAEMVAAGEGSAERVTVAGPPVELPGEGVQTVALALHELATNAVKHGALAQPTGLLSIEWRVEEKGDGDRRLTIDWREIGVTIREPPARSGYGSELIIKALPYQLQAETSLQFTPDGVWCRIDLPASAFAITAAESLP